MGKNGLRPRGEKVTVLRNATPVAPGASATGRGASKTRIGRETNGTKGRAPGAPSVQFLSGDESEMPRDSMSGGFVWKCRIQSETDVRDELRRMYSIMKGSPTRGGGADAARTMPTPASRPSEVGL